MLPELIFQNVPSLIENNKFPFDLDVRCNDFLEGQYYICPMANSHHFTAYKIRFINL